MISRIKGTRDLLDLDLYNFAINRATSHLELYNFTRIETPILENVELFQRSLGQDTDVVNKEMFLIDPKGKSERICLRPEATASIARAFIENGIQQVPWKVFTYGPMFRYERPQKGRFRQFYQMSIEIVGTDSVAQDVECIVMLDRLFSEKWLLSNYALQVNFLGCAQDRAEYKKLLRTYLDTIGDAALCATCLQRKETNIMRIFDCKNPACQEVYRNAPLLQETLCAACADEWKFFQEQLELLSVPFVIQPLLVRGLDYYSKTVFEFVSNALGAQSAFCGGGRYDTLLSELGSKKDYPSIGAAIGIDRVMLLLEEIKDTLPLPHKPLLYAILPLFVAQQPLALLLADTLRAAGLTVEVLLEGDSLKSMMRKANKLGAGYCLLLGDEEQANKAVKVKNMMNGAEETVAQVDLIGLLKR